jgi:tetratricopeptide (TPR) repeat protein
VPSPSDPTVLLNLAQRYLADGQLAAAQEKCLQILDAHHHHPGALEVLGAILGSQGRPAEAVRVFNALTVQQPTVSGHWQNLGAMLRAAGQRAQSLAAFERALRLDGPNAGLLYNLGALQMERLDYEAAHLALRDAVHLAPRDARIRWTYAQCCYDMGQRQAAVTAVADWELLDGLTPEILVSIALLLVTSGAANLALPALQRLRTDPPARGHAAVGYALLLERLHRLDEARAVMLRLERDEPGAATDTERLAMSAVLADRAGRHDEAHRLLTAALAQHPQFVHRYNLLYPLAKACDALGRYDEAYAAAAEAHRSQLAFLQRATGKDCAQQSQLWALTAHGCEPADVARWPGAGAAVERSPIFIVGFPRSGTTLLEQVLDAHPALQSMDEQPFMLQAIVQVTERGVGYPNELGKLSDSDLQDIRARYWEAVRSRISLVDDRRLVDKNPMNMVLLPIIRRLFPNASVILAIRHPYDTVLSCFLQHFRSDLALLGRDLTSLAGAYDRAFGFWYAQNSLLHGETHELKYEQLIADFASEVGRLCEFLRLPLHEAMLAPWEHARAKGFVSTPSYAQILEPVSNRAVGRWQHYRSHFDHDVSAALMPWIERWGYSSA